MPWLSAADQASRPADLYRFGPGLTVSIRGERRARAYFRAEYASAAHAPGPEVPAVEAVIGTRVRAGAHGTTGEHELLGAHKLARWRASLPVRPEADTMRVAVAVRGPLGLALVQSRVIEPLVSLAAVRAGSVLLPGAAVAQEIEPCCCSAAHAAVRRASRRGRWPQAGECSAMTRSSSTQTGSASHSQGGCVYIRICRGRRRRRSPRYRRPCEAGSPLSDASMLSRKASSPHR